MALVLRTGAARAGALELATQLLDHCGGLRALARAAAGELAGQRGIGPAKRASLEAAFELGRRLGEHRLREGEPIRSPADVHRHFYGRTRDREHECFFAVLLDARHRVRGECLISQGTLTASLVHPREVFRDAVREAAAAVVLVHNHPSGDPSPSLEDRRVTDRLVSAGEIMGIRVIDHVVVAERGFFSFAQEGSLGSPGEAPAWADRSRS